MKGSTPSAPTRCMEPEQRSASRRSLKRLARARRLSETVLSREVQGNLLATGNDLRINFNGVNFLVAVLLPHLFADPHLSDFASWCLAITAAMEGNDG